MEDKSTKSLIVIISLACFGLVFGVIAIVFFLKFSASQAKLKSELENIDSLKTRLETIEREKNIIPATKFESVGSVSLSYFKSKIFPKYPNLQNEFSVNDISKVIEVLIKEESKSRGIGSYFVEVKEASSSSNIHSYYLVTTTVQKKLVDVKSAYSDPSGEGCSIDDYFFVGNENGLGRELLDKNGYIILTGTCADYGGGTFSSAYKLSTGEKVVFKGDISISGTTYKGVSKTGNVLGQIIGIYGVLNPIVVVRFGSDSQATLLEKVSSIGFFDLQTGKLISEERFK